MKELREILDELARRNKLFLQIKSRMVLREWEGIVGEHVARHTTPFINGNTLVITCDDPIWLMEISFFKDEIKRKFNDLAGIEIVKKVVLKRR